VYEASVEERKPPHLQIKPRPGNDAIKMFTAQLVGLISNADEQAASYGLSTHHLMLKMYRDLADHAILNPPRGRRSQISFGERHASLLRHEIDQQGKMLQHPALATDSQHRRWLLDLSPQRPLLRRTSMEDRVRAPHEDLRSASGLINERARLDRRCSAPIMATFFWRYAE